MRFPYDSTTYFYYNLLYLLYDGPTISLSLQLAVHYTLISPQQFKGYQQSDLIKNKKNFPISFTTMSMNTLKHGTCTLPPIDGLV